MTTAEMTEAKRLIGQMLDTLEPTAPVMARVARSRVIDEQPMTTIAAALAITVDDAEAMLAAWCDLVRRALAKADREQTT